MGDIADDMASGFQCSHCGTCFENEHGHPVLCEDCFKDDKGKTGLPKTQHPEIGDDEDEEDDVPHIVPEPAPDPLQPDAALLCKLGSIIVHADEMTSPSGHSFDADALKILLKDPDVKRWLASMDEMALIPKKR